MQRCCEQNNELNILRLCWLWLVVCLLPKFLYNTNKIVDLLICSKSAKFEAFHRFSWRFKNLIRLSLHIVCVRWMFMISYLRLDFFFLLSMKYLHLHLMHFVVSVIFVELVLTYQIRKLDFRTVSNLFFSCKVLKHRNTIQYPLSNVYSIHLAGLCHFISCCLYTIKIIKIEYLLLWVILMMNMQELIRTWRKFEYNLKNTSFVYVNALWK